MAMVVLDLAHAEFRYPDPLERGLIHMFGAAAFHFGLGLFLFGGAVQVLLYIEGHLFDMTRGR